jgi:peptidyl-prolyl cis-trans isomerase D
MATLGKIRNHGVLLIVLIGVALLIFIVTDFINNGQAFFNDQKANVGKINSEKIKYQDFYSSISEYTDFYKIEMNNDALTDEMTEQIRQETWNQIVMRKLLEKDAISIGMSVPLAELKKLTMSNNPSPIIEGRAIFRDENGRFDATRVATLISQLDNAEIARQVQSEELLKMKNYWAFLEQTVKDQKLNEKYSVLLSKALVTNSLEAKYVYENKKTNVSAVYALKPYFAIPDSIISVSQSELKALYSKRKEQFKQNATCDISYVVFDIKPSEADFQAIESDINSAKEEFITTTDIMATTNDLSDVPYNDFFLAKNDIAGDLQEFAFNGEKGVVFGPFLGENNTYKMAKIVEKTFAPDSVKLSRIVVAAQTPAATKAKTDSILTVLKNGALFATVAAQTSADTQTASRGGDLGWVREPFVDKGVAKAFQTAVNEPFTIDAGNYTSIFVVTEKTSPIVKVKFAVIERQVLPSSATQAKIYQDATQFASENTTADKLAEKAQAKGYSAIPATDITHNAPRLGNIKNSRQIIRWAFDNKVNTVSEVQECGAQLVVAGVMHKNAEGYRSVEDVKPVLEAEIRRDKKFELLKKDFENKTIEQLKAENFTTDTIENIAFGSMSAGSLNNDASILALAPIAEVDKLSAPIKGNIGAYVFKVLHKTENPNTFDAKQEIAMLNAQNKNLFYYVIEVLKKAGNVKDERYKFF